MDFKPARILGIESSCDETAAAVVENGRSILSSVVATQIELHAKYGGVFPEVASRQHIRTIYAVIDEALQQSHMGLTDVDAVAVTRGPGLAGSLVVGANMAKALAMAVDKPIVGVNHLEGQYLTVRQARNRLCFSEQVVIVVRRDHNRRQAGYQVEQPP